MTTVVNVEPWVVRAQPAGPVRVVCGAAATTEPGPGVDSVTRRTSVTEICHVILNMDVKCPVLNAADEPTRLQRGADAEAVLPLGCIEGMKVRPTCGAPLAHCARTYCLAAGPPSFSLQSLLHLCTVLSWMKQTALRGFHLGSVSMYLTASPSSLVPALAMYIAAAWELSGSVPVLRGTIHVRNFYLSYDRSDHWRVQVGDKSVRSVLCCPPPPPPPALPGSR